MSNMYPVSSVRELTFCLTLSREQLNMAGHCPRLAQEFVHTLIFVYEEEISK